MYERKRDKELGIRTVGLREWDRGEERYNRYEATPYKALDRLFEDYVLEEGDAVIDFGVGRGRVSIYIHHRFNIPVLGVEVNEKTLDEGLWNIENYQRHHPENDALLHFDYGFAEQYQIDPRFHHFYFFNPFSLDIYIQVFKNIERSRRQHPRDMEMIIYYPLPEVKRYIETKTSFKQVDKIFAYGAHGEHGKFVIYRSEVDKNDDGESA